MSNAEDATRNWLQPKSPPLTVGTVHVWMLPLAVSDPFLDAIRELLSPDERERASRFRFERDMRRFAVARGSVRCILARYLERDAHQVKFSYNTHGKPGLADPPADFGFNVSHSNELAVLAVVGGRNVGIDIEWIRSDVETDNLAERFFSVREQKALCALPPAKRLAAFYHVWTCKEAFLKAQGSGFSRSLDSFDVDVVQDLPARLIGTRPDEAEAARWSLRKLEVPTGYAGAVAVEGSINELHQLLFGDAEPLSVAPRRA